MGGALMGMGKRTARLNAAALDATLDALEDDDDFSVDIDVDDD